MIYEISVFLLCLVGIMLIFVVSLQNSQGGFFSGQGGGESTMIFGGDTGSNIIKKITWYCGFILIFGVFTLALYKNHLMQRGTLYRAEKKEKKLVTEESPKATQPVLPAPEASLPTPEAPLNKEQPVEQPVPATEIPTVTQSSVPAATQENVPTVGKKLKKKKQQ